MGTSYKKIYKSFLSKIKDYVFFELDDDDSMAFCHTLMMNALSKLSNLNNDLSQYDDEIMAFENDLLNIEIEYIATAMAAEWVEPQVNNTVFLRFYVGTKDEKFFAPSAQLSQLRGLRDDWIARTKKIHRDYTFRNSEYFLS